LIRCWKQLASPACRLVTVSGHTVTHPSLHDLKEDQVMAEIGRARQRLEAQLAVAVFHFAYPYGQAQIVVSRISLLQHEPDCDWVTTRDGNHLFISTEIT
jgi:peptidoglycan/xylan/chitin deacetylase (PgdA/CDA1 family)